jgi:hypothetical protein
MDYKGIRVGLYLPEVWMCVPTESKILNKEGWEHVLCTLPRVKFNSILECILDIKNIYLFSLSSTKVEKYPNAVNHGHWGE